MSRISIPTVETSLEASKPLLAAVKQSLGAVPNLMKLFGHSPAALEGYLALNGGLSEGKLDAKPREHIALKVLTNYVNNAFQTDIDFPVVNAKSAA